MVTHQGIKAARDAAIGVMRGAVQIIKSYRDTLLWRRPDWPTKGGGKLHRAQQFGAFIRLVTIANDAVKAIDDVLPRPDGTVRYGSTVSGTAHGVAVKYANTVVGEICAAFNDVSVEDHDEAAACDLYNRALAGDVDAEFLDRCQEQIRAALAAAEIIDTEELFFAIDNESKRADIPNRSAKKIRKKTGPRRGTAALVAFAMRRRAKGEKLPAITAAWNNLHDEIRTVGSITKLLQRADKSGHSG